MLHEQSPQNSKPTGPSDAQSGDQLFQSTISSAAARVECSPTTHYPALLTFENPDLSLVTKALEECGHLIDVRVLTYMVDSLRSDARLIPAELLDLGIVNSNIEVGESRVIFPGSKSPGQLLDRFVEFVPPDNDEKEDWKAKGLLNGGKIYLRLKDDDPNRGFEIDLFFKESVPDQEERALHWEIADRFAYCFGGKSLPAAVPAISLSNGEAPPRFQVGALEITFQDIPDIDGKTRSCAQRWPESSKLVTLDSEADNHIGIGVEGPRRDYAESTEADLTNITVQNITSLRLREIVQASGLPSMDVATCQHLLDAVKFAHPIEKDRLGFISEKTPVTISQTLRYNFDKEDFTYAESSSIDWDLEGSEALGGLHFEVAPTRHHPDGMATQTHTTFDWKKLSELPRHARKKLLALVTKRK